MDDRDRALLIYLNSYLGVSDLRGCRADAEDLARLLTEQYGFGPRTIRLLGDADAILSNVRDGLRWLLDGARASCRRVVAFFGHGSLTVDRDGDERSGWDSAFALHNMDWSPGTYLVDDELRATIGAFPAGSKLVVWLDACHSGTGTREIAPAAAAVLGGPLAAPLATAVGPAPEAVALARFVAPPEEIRREVARRAGPRARRDVAGPDLLALSGCRDDQTAADAWLGGGYRGAFSFYGIRLLRSRPDIGRAELHRRVCADLARARFEQVPQLEALPARGGLFGATPRGAR